MSDRIKNNFLETLNRAIDESIKQIRTEPENVVSEENESAERRRKTKTVSEAKLLESYKRQDNIRIVGVNEDRSSDNKISKSYSQSMQNVLQLDERVGATVPEHNISIAHRLPSRKQSQKRRIFVRFSRRKAKIEMLQKKKHHGTLQKTKHIQVFDDLSLPRLRFFK